MVTVLGSGDSLLRVIEKAFPAADIHVRGNEISAVGDAREVAIVQRLFDEMMLVLRTGQPMTEDAVERSIAMLRASENGEGPEETPAQVLTQNILSSRGRTIRPKTLNQKRYVDAIDKHTIVFGIGPAGTGKTYLAMAKAVQALQSKLVPQWRLIASRSREEQSIVVVPSMSLDFELAPAALQAYEERFLFLMLLLRLHVPQQVALGAIPQHCQLPGVNPSGAVFAGVVDADGAVGVAAGGTVTVNAALHVRAIDLTEIVVTGALSRRAGEDVMSPVSVVGGAELDRRLSSTVAATLDAKPGLAVTSLGPVTGRPVIRGLGGDRILILERKLVVQRDELVMAQREIDEMAAEMKKSGRDSSESVRAAWRDLEAAGAGPRSRGRAGIEARREPAVAEQQRGEHGGAGRDCGEGDVAVVDQEQAAEEQGLDVGAGAKDVAGEDHPSR